MIPLLCLFVAASFGCTAFILCACAIGGLRAAGSGHSIVVKR